MGSSDTILSIREEKTRWHVLWNPYVYVFIKSHRRVWLKILNKSQRLNSIRNDNTHSNLKEHNCDFFQCCKKFPVCMIIIKIILKH